MRRDLAIDGQACALPLGFSWLTLSNDNAVAVHQLLTLGRIEGGGRVKSLAQWLAAFETDPEFDSQLCFVIDDRMGVVAVAQCWTSAYVRDLVVHPRARGQGLGKVLLERAFDAFRLRREGQVDLKVMENNLPARRLYERAGMRYVLRGELDPV